MTESLNVELRFGLRVSLRDGIHLSATVYLPRQLQRPTPCLLALTPYVADSSHETAMFFASRGLPFVVTDVRGRGNSEGTFRPMIQEGNDGYDVVQWLARQPYCDGSVGMWGGSYLGFSQW